MSGRIGRAAVAAALGAAMALGGVAAVAGISLPHLPAPKKKEPVTVETVLGQVKVKLIGQAGVTYVLTQRDAKGAEVDTPQTHTVTYTDVSWADRCVMKVKSTTIVQDNVDEGWRRDHSDEQTIDLHGGKPFHLERYAAYLTDRGAKDPKAKPDVRFTAAPHIYAIPAGDGVLVAVDHEHADALLHDLNHAVKMCALEKAPA